MFDSLLDSLSPVAFWLWLAALLLTVGRMCWLHTGLVITSRKRITQPAKAERNRSRNKPLEDALEELRKELVEYRQRWIFASGMLYLLGRGEQVERIIETAKNPPAAPRRPLNG